VRLDKPLGVSKQDQLTMVVENLLLRAGHTGPQVLRDPPQRLRSRHGLDDLTASRFEVSPEVPVRLYFYTPHLCSFSYSADGSHAGRSYSLAGREIAGVSGTSSAAAGLRPYKAKRRGIA
jgi:hypothetical protein